MSFLDSDRCYTDKEITATFGDAYDHPQIHDGYKDDGDFDEQPFRYVKNWSLWLSSSSSSSSSAAAASDGGDGGVKSQKNSNPQALPNGYFDTGKKKGNYYLQGLVVPPRANNHYDSIPIRLHLTAADFVSVDRSKRYRGFWIILANGGSNASCYWLHDPDESIHAGATRSQAEVHFDHVAWLAVLSNLVDAVFTLNVGAAWANESVMDVYERLSSAAAPNNNKQQSPPPFDKDLLVQYKDQIYPHLLNSQLYLTAGCKFMKSLKSCKPPPLSKKVDRLQVKASTDAALERSQQHPWGEPKTTPSLAMMVNADDGDEKTTALLLFADSMVESDDDHDDDGSDYSAGGKGDGNAANKPTKKRRKKRKDDSQEIAGAATAKALSKKRQNTTMCTTSQNHQSTNKETATSIAIKIKNNTDSLKEEKEVEKEYKDDRGDGVHPAAAPARLEPHLFAEDNMREALKLCNDFLVPKPSNVYAIDASSWTRVQAHEFCIKDRASSESLLNMASTWVVDEDTKLEGCLLVVEAFRQSCRKGQSKDVRKVVASSKMSKMVFNTWRIHAMTRLREGMGSIKGTTALFLLTSIAGLIAACESITSNKQLNTLKDRGVDWQDIVDKFKVFIPETSCRSKKLRKACDAAQRRINDINKASNTKSAEDTAAVGGKTEQSSNSAALNQKALTTASRTTGSIKETESTATAVRQQHAATARVGSVAQIKDKTIVKEDSQHQVVHEPIPKKNVNDEKLRRQHEEDTKRRQHEADEKRRQRILQLTSRPGGPLEDTTPPTTTTAKAPDLVAAKLAPSREQTQSFWIPKVHRPWDETTLMPPPYFVAHAESLGFPSHGGGYSGRLNEDYSTQQQWQYQQFPSMRSTSGPSRHYASTGGGGGMGRGRDKNNPVW